ncbi:MAG: hypothetical protein KJ556_20910 [Gammaproteobacteria bacterium]|nr:hypothetical protein [Gammaproteobacteria bacterium]
MVTNTDGNVQTDAVQPGVSQEGTKSKESADNTLQTDKQGAEGQQQVQTQSLTPEQIQKMINDALTPVVEGAKREIQSIKDKSKSEVEAALRRGQVPNKILSQVKTRIQEESPDLAKEIEIAELREKVGHYEGNEIANQTQQQQAMFAQQFQDQMNQFITTSGVDPKDKKIDWGDDATDYLTKQSRILNSVSKILKSREDDIKKTIEQQVKDAETKLRKELGLDSVSTTNQTPKSNKPDSEKTPNDWISAGLQKARKKTGG